MIGGSGGAGHSYYDRFEKSAQDSSGGGNIMPMSTFGHKRSPSGESLNRNFHLAGAKLVLPPTGEIPMLKHVDKSLISRPKIPPPGPPPAGKI